MDEQRDSSSNRQGSVPSVAPGSARESYHNVPDLLLTSDGYPVSALITQSESDVMSANTTLTSLGNDTIRSFPHILGTASSAGGPGATPAPSTVSFLPLVDADGQNSANASGNLSSRDVLPGKSKRKHLESQSERDYHKKMQDRYKTSRQRHYTDPVDFEGILRIIGGIGRWQVGTYVFIGLQQIPHAMFNLLILFMVIEPKHWCYVKDMDSANHPTEWQKEWTMEKIRNISIPYRTMDKKKRGGFDECRMYERNYQVLSHMSFEKAHQTIQDNATVKYCTNWTFDRSEMRETIVTQWNLVCDQSFRRADAHLAYSLGYIFGCFVSGLSSDRFGRKPTVIGFGILASLLGIALAYATYFPVFLVIRFFSAVVNEAAGLAAYVLCMEITGTRYRATVGSFLQAPWALGYTLLAALAYLTRDWTKIQIIISIIQSITIFLICVISESPRWLIVNNRLLEAEVIIRKACKMNGKTLPPDLELIKHAEKREWVKRKERASLLSLVKSQELLVRTVIVFIIWSVAALVYYGVTLNLADQSGPKEDRMFSGNLFHNNVIAGAIELPVLFVCVFLLAAGRKRSQMACLILSGIMMLGVVLSPEEIPWLRLLFMLLGKACAQAAFNILYIFTSEMYPTVIRNSVVGTSSMVARIGSGVAGYVALLSDITLPVVPMIIFGVFSFVAGTLVIFLPETLNQPLPDTLKDAVEFLK